ncbi:MAG: carboxypeptidase-like regulatory domain-containing protein, partial [Flavobacterium sp.]
MHKILTLFFLFAATVSHSQIKGKITSSNGEAVPFVSVTIANTYTGTTANENGQYELGVKAPGKYTVQFQSLGYKTKKLMIEALSMPHTLNVVLEDDSYELGEVVVSNKENPANAIIRNAIANKKANSARTGRFEADFYSKGIFRVKDVPKKIMGMKIEAPDGMIDSTGSGIIYLSETVSKITFEQPNNLKERIIASKISGNDNGFSYNTAMATNYNFYENYVTFG